MAADKRAARLGVLALVATLLFGAVGARLWFLQTVQAESLQQTVDARKTKTVRLVPERGRIFDADGRILADNERVLTVSVDWDVIRRDTDRAELFTRLSGWLEMPVEEMEARYDSELYSRYLPMPLKEGVKETVAIALAERVEDFPGVTIEKDWRRVLPVRPARQPRPRLHGGDHGRGPGALRRARLRHVGRRRAGRAQRRRAEHGGDAPREVGRGRLRGRRQQPHRPRDQLQGAGQRDGRPAVDRPRPAAVRRAAPADPAAPEAPVHGGQPGGRADSRPTAPRCGRRWTPAWPSAPRSRTRHRPAR